MYTPSFIVVALATVFAASVPEAEARGFLARIHSARSTPITQLSDGNEMQYGNSSLAPGLRNWQSSGILTRGCDIKSAKINDCYGIYLSANQNEHTGDSPRQRIEFRTKSQLAGHSAHYTWKQYDEAPDTSTSVSQSDFSHRWQIMDGQDIAPVVTFDAINDTATVLDYAPRRINCGGRCPAIPLKSFVGRNLLHSLKVTFGPNGQLDYVLTDADSGKQLLTYNTNGYMGGNTSYVKYGCYRTTQPGQAPIHMAVGDFAYEQLS
ncbi:hypothetical protein SISNIDRAFT_455848 [Sistotremastrum niveocremeum HHB9708]|uniref:Uncharacterized protein n=1 Tax=Sistotremastrum niveocremeum HHB9708 TaxID=1314777 RepID=A0A164T5L4_9AGAM|nr:hypothetical protein SISNIDRAFT_455848 [Sistotremastrum niveocremeum HHB9708]